MVPEPEVLWAEARVARPEVRASRARDFGVVKDIVGSGFGGVLDIEVVGERWI